jgi:predicted aspartyl protease
VSVESSHFPYLPVTLSLGGKRLTFEALLDTGIDGGLAVTEESIASGQAAEWNLSFALADGSLVNVPAYLGTVQVGELSPVTTIVIALGDEPLLGRAVSDQFNITLEHGQRIVVEP